MIWFYEVDGSPGTRVVEPPAAELSGPLISRADLRRIQDRVRLALGSLPAEEAACRWARAFPDAPPLPPPRRGAH